MTDSVVIFTTNDGTRLKVEDQGSEHQDNQDLKEILKYAFLAINWGLDEYKISEIKSVEVTGAGFEEMTLDEALGVAGLNRDDESLLLSDIIPDPDQ